MVNNMEKINYFKAYKEVHEIIRCVLKDDLTKG